jgi:hypothetical protein
VIFENMKKTGVFLEDMDDRIADMKSKLETLASITAGPTAGPGRRTLLLGFTEEQDQPDRTAAADLKQEVTKQEIMGMIKSGMAAMQVEITETNGVMWESMNAEMAQNSEETKKELKGEMAKMMKEQESRIIQGILEAVGVHNSS